MSGTARERRWVWATLALSSITIAATVFSAWEVIENRFFSHADYVTLHYLYITRGIASSLLLAFWAAWYVLRQRRLSEEALRRSHERYRGLLEASPGAVVLYDSALRILEWNAASERLYGYPKTEVLGRTLPTIPADKQKELEEGMATVADGEPVLGLETLRRNRNGEEVAVQLSLLPFRESTGQLSFLEVTEDIRERVRLRQSLLELEKLTSMGKMAAGTAHHLNTPLAAMLLRVQMMRDRADLGPYAADLERIESGIRFCQHFVQRLLEFSRRGAVRKQPEEIGRTLQSVISFLAPATLSKRAAVSLDVGTAGGEYVLADRNLLEVLFSSLLSNALDALPPQGGTISVVCRRTPAGTVEVRIIDNGCGISPADLPRVFEPFFTTKGPGKGTGLGLAIARNIVLEHGGDIRLENASGGGGVTVSLELPVSSRQEAARAAS